MIWISDVGRRQATDQKKGFFLCLCPLSCKFINRLGLSDGDRRILQQVLVVLRQKRVIITRLSKSPRFIPIYLIISLAIGRVTTDQIKGYHVLSDIIFDMYPKQPNERTAGCMDNATKNLSGYMLNVCALQIDVAIKKRTTFPQWPRTNFSQLQFVLFSSVNFRLNLFFISLFEQTYVCIDKNVPCI